jgi:hypothetical protein
MTDKISCWIYIVDSILGDIDQILMQLLIVSRKQQQQYAIMRNFAGSLSKN